MTSPQEVTRRADARRSREAILKAATLDLARQSPERTRKLLEEANLFVEEAHVVYGRMAGTATK